MTNQQLADYSAFSLGVAEVERHKAAWRHTPYSSYLAMLIATCDVDSIGKQVVKRPPLPRPQRVFA